MQRPVICVTWKCAGAGKVSWVACGIAIEAAMECAAKKARTVLRSGRLSIMCEVKCRLRSVVGRLVFVLGDLADVDVPLFENVAVLKLGANVEIAGPAKVIEVDIDAPARLDYIFA